MKQNKFLGVLAIALSLALTACGNAGEESKPAEECKKHTWGNWEVVQPATCTEDGSQKRVCSVCGKEETKAIKAAHTWGEWVTTTPATCQAEGSKERECSVCHTKETETIAKTDHQWGEWVDVTAATCTEAGSHKHTCSVCQTEETEAVEALGHDWGEWVDLTPATCTEAGSHKHTCNRCNVEETEDVAPLGHDIQLVDDGSEPEPGKAKVRMYTCAHGCGTSYFGFKASEVTNESKDHLVIGEDGGARFWGRPIGNDVVLNDQGDPDENSHEAVFNDQQPGDFFEYVFDLEESQAGNYYCYCDATPAQWMRNNNMDFFACKSGDTDWTRGMYIDDIPETEENEKGTEIDDYRYILYVDGQPKAFDDSITNPVRSDNRGEYVIPFLFQLHKGENRISLRMAGGYRSTFYNFTFRAVLPEA